MDKEKSNLKLIASRKVKELSEDSEWSILQQLVQEIEADFIVKDQKQYSVELLKKLLEEEVERRYKEEPDKLEILLDGIPSRYSISLWRKKKGWGEAIWTKIRGTGLFTSEKRAKVIESLYDKAVQRKDTNAAKLWLTLSGDYSEKLDIRTDIIADKYKEINEILHKKNR